MEASMNVSNSSDEHHTEDDDYDDDDDDDVEHSTATASSSSTGNGGLATLVALHRKRHFTTPDQKLVLEYVYQLNTRPNKRLQTWLATRLMMSSRRVRVWFQNKRTRDKSRNIVPTRQNTPMDDDIIMMISSNNYLKLAATTTTTSSTSLSPRGTSAISTITSVTEEQHVYPRPNHYFSAPAYVCTCRCCCRCR
jgi:hypothetical protein